MITIRKSIKTPFGKNLDLEMPVNDHQPKMICNYGFYARSLCFILREISMKEKNVFYDIGANIGFFSLLFAKLSKSGIAISFEPCTKIRTLFESNKKNNNVESIKIFPLAVGKKSSDGFLSLNKFDTGETRFSNNKGEKVKIISLHEFIENTKLFPNFLKIDIQGYEIDALLGLLPSLGERKPLIFFEFAPYLIPNSRTEIFNVFQHYDELGYNFHLLRAHDEYVLEHIPKSLLLDFYDWAINEKTKGFFNIVLMRRGIN